MLISQRVFQLVMPQFEFPILHGRCQIRQWLPGLKLEYTAQYQSMAKRFHRIFVRWESGKIEVCSATRSGMTPLRSTP
jgi:hypothetical protein